MALFEETEISETTLPLTKDRAVIFQKLRGLLSRIPAIVAHTASDRRGERFVAVETATNGRQHCARR